VCSAVHRCRARAVPTDKAPTPSVPPKATVGLYAEWNNNSAGFVSVGGVRAAEQLRLINEGALQMADVSQQVTPSVLTEFENHSTLKPSDDNTTALDALLDQVAAWSTALAPPRAASRAAA
jgi:NAD(P)H-dependent FMN reductase